MFRMPHSTLVYCIKGFHKSEEFIVTQFPTDETSNDFWKMIWDHNCQTIVLLTQSDQIVISFSQVLEFK